MNEAAREYYSEVASRSITAKSSHAKNGGNSEKLGNRQLTRKEIEEKHGPVKTYTFDDFLQFSEFREMPLDWQAGYINHLQDKYDVGLTQINRDLFGCRDDNQLRSHLRLKGILDKVNPDKRRGRTKLHEFRRDIREYRMRPLTPEIKPEPVEKPLPKFMDWADFKALGRVQQQIFTKRLLDEYGLGLKAINAELFNSDSNNFRGYLVSHGFDMAKDFGIKRGGNKSGKEHDESLAKLRRDIVEWKKALSAKTAETIQEIKSCGATNADISSIMDIPESIVRNLASVEKGETIKVNDVNKELGLEPVPEEKNTVIAEPIQVSEMRMGFSTSYISTGVDMDRVALINQLFAGQKVRVKIEVEVL